MDGDRKRDEVNGGRRNLLGSAVAAVAGAVAALTLRSEVAQAGHDSTNAFHLGVRNDGGITPTRLVGNVDVGAFGGPSATIPPGGALMVFNGDGSAGKGWAIVAGVSAGAVGAINANANSGVGIEGNSNSGPGMSGHSNSGDGVVGSSENGRGVLALSRSATDPALVANWAGPADSPTPHSGVFGSTRGRAPGIHGMGPDLGVFGDARMPGPEERPTDGIGVSGRSRGGTGVRGESTGGTGVLGRSVSGAGVTGRSDSGAGVVGHASPTGPGIEGFASVGTAPGLGRPGVVGHASSTNSGVAGQSEGAGPAVHGIQAGATGLGVRATAQEGGAIALQAVNHGGGIALDVQGKARLSTAGVATIPPNADSATVVAPVDPSNSIVLGTFLADPGDRVLWVEVRAGSFSLNLRQPGEAEGRRRHGPIAVAWLALERLV